MGPGFQTRLSVPSSFTVKFSGILCPHFSSHSVQAGCVLMSLSLITSFQECAGTAKVPATRNIFLCPCPGVGEHLDSKRQSVQSECWALGPCNGGWRKRTLLDLVWSNDRKQRFQSSCRFGKVSPCLLWAACCQDFVLSWAVSFSQRMPVLPCEQPSYGLRDMEETS